MYINIIKNNFFYKSKTIKHFGQNCFVRTEMKIAPLPHAN